MKLPGTGFCQLLQCACIFICSLYILFLIQLLKLFPCGLLLWPQQFQIASDSLLMSKVIIRSPWGEMVMKKYTVRKQQQQKNFNAFVFTHKTFVFFCKSIVLPRQTYVHSQKHWNIVFPLLSHYLFPSPVLCEHEHFIYFVWGNKNFIKRTHFIFFSHISSHHHVPSGVLYNNTLMPCYSYLIWVNIIWKMKH